MKKTVCRLLAVLLLSAPLAARAEDDAAALKRRVSDLEKRLAEIEKGMQPAAGSAAPATPAAPAPPMSDYDYSWLNGNSRVNHPLIDNDWFTSQFMVDVNYTYDFNRPADHSIDGVCEVGRSNEFQLQQLGIGGDLHYKNVRGRLITQFGMYSQMTPRNDASPSRGQWNLGQAYQYISEGYGGYHFDVLHGVNVDAGIFMSYVGLFSYYQNENWAYSPSYVSANTPWFFNGMRIQIFPTEHLKIEPWIINGWQSYGQFNEAPGLGVQVLWRPNGWLELLSNDYWGHDTLGAPARTRVHTDDSIEVKYYDRPKAEVSKMAFTVTLDAGCEDGDGVSCFRSTPNKGPQQDFLGFMVYDRTWFHQDKFALTVGGGAIHNPGRYLVLIPPINGATASTGSPYFTGNPGDRFDAWDNSVTFDYMPNEWVTWRLEYNHRQSSVPYFAGRGGMTPAGGNTGTPGTLVPGFTPDLRRSENRVTAALLVRL